MKYIWVRRDGSAELTSLTSERFCSDKMQIWMWISLPVYVSCAMDRVVRFTRPFSPFLHTASDQKLEPGKAWNEATLSRYIYSRAMTKIRMSSPRFDVCIKPLDSLTINTGVPASDVMSIGFWASSLKWQANPKPASLICRERHSWRLIWHSWYGTHTREQLLIKC